MNILFSKCCIETYILYIDLLKSQKDIQYLMLHYMFFSMDNDTCHIIIFLCNILENTLLITCLNKKTYNVRCS